MSYILGYHDTDYSRLISLIQHYPSLSGVIFFQRNIPSLEEFRKTLDSLRALKPSLKLCLDFEGGKVNRLRSLGSLTEPPFILGSHYDSVPATGKKSVKHRLAQQIERVARLYDSLGITTVFGPCIDTLGISPVIAQYQRSYSKNIETIRELSSVFIEIFLSYGIECVIKHYPSHAQALGDSHYQCTIDNRQYEELDPERRLYADLIAKYPGLGIMLSHCIFPALDSCPVSLSMLWHQDRVLHSCQRIYTDCLDMKGVGPFLNPSRLQSLRGYKVFSTLRGHFCESYLSEEKNCKRLTEKLISV